jgi:site-specific DNA-methyltransferase (adenine-specific)
LFPETQARQASQASQRRKVKYDTIGKLSLERSAWNAVEDYAGSASRYFYHAKASKADRDEGVNGLNPHPTVKPTQLMRYLVKLVTPQGGLVLDPFMGSGTTGKACMLEGMRFIGMELSEEYVKIAEARIEHARQQMSLLNYEARS